MNSNSNSNNNKNNNINKNNNNNNNNMTQGMTQGVCQGMTHKSNASPSSLLRGSRLHCINFFLVAFKWRNIGHRLDNVRSLWYIIP